MQLVEKHIIKKNKVEYSTLDDLCFKSKNLYNLGLYLIRQEFINNNKYINYYDIEKKIKSEYEECYRGLPSKVSQQTLRLLDKNFKSFFNANSDYKKSPNKYLGKPRIPNYKHKTEGRYITTYTNQAILKKYFKDGFITLSGTNIKIRTKIENFFDIAQVRIVPRINHFVIEVVYNKTEKEIKTDGIISSIDLGLNNLAMVTYSDGSIPNIVNGKPLKSINQFYNKNKAYPQSKLKGNQKTSNRIQRLTNKRNNKVNDYLHKASRILVNQLVSSNVSTVVIGLNKQWKQDINISAKNNQNFVQIPHSRFIEMIKYKLMLEGITSIITEESYTSKCSFLDLEEIKKHETYLGKRIKRGMFRSSNGRKINADVNGSYNIMRKAIPNVFKDNGIEGVVVHPKHLTV